MAKVKLQAERMNKFEDKGPDTHTKFFDIIKYIIH